MFQGQPPAEMEAKKIKEAKAMSDPKIVFKSEIPKEALNSLAMLFIEEINKLLESEEGKAEFEKWMQEATNKE